ncbi:hypothetical protein TNIN_428681 [Trichonephila inaurata madagascariensis]|uniref:Uncharacterized protein n=1 Tax=Trichonephila inaurata madagascariensis TaxID=2747483 RepID=A0A8X6YX15_9ARAC|nr:hypothetical protein TNIN_428681 [Trichonephila inaurata madagascariensis]
MYCGRMAKVFFSGACQAPGWQNTVLPVVHVPWLGCRSLYCARSMSSGRVTKLCSASGVCPMSAWQSSFLRQVDVQFPGNRTLSWIRGMSIVFKADICRASGECPVSCRKNSVLLQGHGQYSCVRTQFFQGHFQCPVVRNLSSVRSNFSSWEAELCPMLGACTVVGWQNSVLRQGYVKWQVAELCPTSGASP